MIVLDASALIALLGQSVPLHHRAVTDFERLGPAQYAISPITHAEVLVGPTRAGTLERTRTALTALGVEELELPTMPRPGWPGCERPPHSSFRTAA